MRVRARSHSAGSPAHLAGTCLSTFERNDSLLPELESSLDRSHSSAVTVGDSLVESFGISKHDFEDGIVNAGHPPSGASCAGCVPASSGTPADGIMAAGLPLLVESFSGRAHTLSAATAGEGTSSRLLEVIESVFVSLSSCVHNSSPSSLRVSSHTRAHEICRAVAFACLPHPHSPLRSACRSLPALPVAHADDTLMHDMLNSSLRVQRATSYNPEGVVALNSRRKVRLTSTVRFGSVEQTVDMSPAPAAGTYRRSVDEMHGQRQVSRKRQAVCSVGDPDPGPGPGLGGRSGLVGGSLDRAAAIRGIPCSLVMPPGRHQRAPQSLGWEWVCGTEKSGVWVLKGDARTYNLPRDLDDVGVVWERRSGYETAWATPGHVCSCSYDYGHEPVLPQANPSVFTEAVNLWSRVASLLTPWCAKGEVPTGVNLNRYAGDGSFIPWHCDNERLFGSPSEPKVIVSMSLGHSVLFKLCRRASEKTVTPIWLDHFDLLAMDGLTQEEFLHSTASELEGPRVNLTYRWISQHIRSCPQAGLICGALPSEAQDLAEPNSCREGSRKSK